MLLTFLFTLAVRLVPARWGIYLNEFDPYYEYYLAEKLLEEGGGNPVKGIIWWFSWWFDRDGRDTLFWAPNGRDLRASSQPGAAFFSAAAYAFLNAMGVNVDLYTVHALIPPVGASLSVFFIYLLAKELWGVREGALAAVLISCAWPFIYRTNLGAKHEGIAIPFMILAFYLFLRGARRDSIWCALGASASMIITVLSWGGFLYPWNLVALVSFLWLLLNPTNTALAKSYVTYSIPTVAAIALTPRFGPQTAFFSAAGALPLLTLALSILVLIHVAPGLLKMAGRERRYIVIGVAVAGGAAILVALWLGVLYTLPGRILAVLVPLWRPVGVTTVAEHAVPTWASIYGDYSLLIPLSAFGALISGYNSRRSLSELFAFMLWLSSGYAAASMARLTLLLAPAVALLTSRAFIGVVDKLQGLKTRGRERQAPVGGELRVFTILVLVLLMVPYLFNYQAALITHQPALILSASVPVIDYNYQYLDWISALEWIKANVPEGTVIATWWDYGYWISVNTRRNTTCDNSTIDSKRIMDVARAFLSSEEEAVEIFRSMNVSYVVVYEPFLSADLPYLGIKVYFSSASGGLGGDLAKSYQMARWIGEDPDKYITVAYVQSGQSVAYVLVPANTTEARNATLYRLLFTKTANRWFYIFEPLPFTGQAISNYNGPVLTVPQPEHFELVYASKPNEWVLVFRVKYETP